MAIRHDINQRLAKSKFRSSFRLGGHDRAYIQKAGLVKIESHARDFILKFGYI
ncbi:MAG: DUF4186 family protein [Candidatus Omnitrophica bacterium]|nr:DUF4186 family protein [Candidatus Omnitrophota bacterium]MBU4479728.1 DUF4186 family protein [Candidatus Omnitrophota bacterium]MCG2703214.1 DUF4186 family protein [Candidatus Omnitrophota bacterium]